MLSKKDFTRWRLCGIGSISTLAISFVIIFIGAIIFSTLEKKENIGSNEFSHDHRYIVHNPRTNETTVGIVSLKKLLKKNEYQSFVDKEGNNILISPFGSEEYRCVGSCYCDEFRRNAGAGVLKQGIVYLVAAVSALIAYDKAKEYFDKECVRSFEDQCDRSRIVSELRKEDCDTWRNWFPSFKHRHQNVEVKGKYEGEAPRKYLCKGRCTSNYIFTGDDVGHQLGEKSLAFECGQYEQEAEVTIDTSEVRKRVDLEFGAERLARKVFSKSTLDPYCRKMSEIDFKHSYAWKPSWRPWKKKSVEHGKVYKKHSLCCGPDTFNCACTRVG